MPFLNPCNTALCSLGDTESIIRRNNILFPIYYYFKVQVLWGKLEENNSVSHVRDFSAPLTRSYFFVSLLAYAYNRPPLGLCKGGIKNLFRTVSKVAMI